MSISKCMCVDGEIRGHVTQRVVCIEHFQFVKIGEKKVIEMETTSSSEHIGQLPTYFRLRLYVLKPLHTMICMFIRQSIQVASSIDIVIVTNPTAKTVLSMPSKWLFCYQTALDARSLN